VVDAGVEAPGGLAAGIALARVCMADLAEVSLVPGEAAGVPLPLVQVHTGHPVEACMASQYAGWALSVGKYFAMGSGPMRAAYGGEPLFGSIGRRETPTEAVGVLEARKLPGEEVVAFIAGKTGVRPAGISLLVAPTASLAGGLQVVCRSVETALHKLHALGFDLERVEAGHGTAPLPPVARDDLAAIGRTNDCVLYGARVTLWVRGDDESLAEAAPRIPSSASRDHGAPFAEVFERCGRDFYKIDPALFSPAEVVLQNLDTGRTHRAGRLEPEVLARSLFD
jgi:methenyltetrahydromethanopterin cyclohydrolase